MPLPPAPLLLVASVQRACLVQAAPAPCAAHTLLLLLTRRLTRQVTALSYCCSVTAMPRALQARVHQGQCVPAKPGSHCTPRERACMPCGSCQCPAHGCALAASPAGLPPVALRPRAPSLTPHTPCCCLCPFPGPRWLHDRDPEPRERAPVRVSAGAGAAQRARSQRKRTTPCCCCCCCAYGAWCCGGSSCGPVPCGAPAHAAGGSSTCCVGRGASPSG